MHKFVVTPSPTLYQTPYELGSYDSTSMNPGATTRLVASIVVLPVRGSALIDVMRSPSMPTEATAS
jgi:hypothetical protein